MNFERLEIGVVMMRQSNIREELSGESGEVVISRKINHLVSPLVMRQNREVVKAVKADLRREISGFGLLVWTYADEHVRAACDGGTYGEVQHGSTVLGRLQDSVSGSGRGSINGLLNPHEDAMAVDALVWAWFDQNGSHRAYLAAHLEKRKAPPDPATLEPQRLVPRLRANGKPYYIYDRSRNVIGVIEDLVGHDEKQIAYARYHHNLFQGLLEVLPGLKLSRWKVVKRD